jgi:protein BCP1
MPLRKKVKTGDDENETVDNENLNSSDDEGEEEVNSNSNDSDSNESDENDAETFEELMIDFEARSPNKADLDIVRSLLQQKLAPFATCLTFSLNELATTIVEQTNIGNVIYQAASQEEENGKEEEPSPFPTSTSATKDDSEENTIFGVLSLIDMNAEKHQKIAKGLIDFILNECEKLSNNSSEMKNIKQQLTTLFKEKRVCYILNERFINVPVDISVPMYESLLADINNVIVPMASSKEAAANAKNSSMDYWLFLTKIYTEQTRKNNRKMIETIYANPEEETFEEFSELKFEIPYGNKASKSTSGDWSKNELEPTLKVLLVPKLRINDALTKIKSLLK